MQDSRVLVGEKELSRGEKLFHLKQKMLEEAEEVFDAKSREELVEELADILEVIDGIRKFADISEEEILEQKRTKLEKSGGFEDSRFCTSIKVPEGHYLVEYCRKNPKQYPEIEE